MFVWQHQHQHVTANSETPMTPVKMQYSLPDSGSSRRGTPASPGGAAEERKKTNLGLALVHISQEKEGVGAVDKRGGLCCLH